MVQGTIEDLTVAIRQKEYELLDREADYARINRCLEEKMRDLYDRRHYLAKILEQEGERMRQFLIHHDAGQEEAESFYRRIYELQDEAERTYKNLLCDLEEELEESKRLFFRERDQLETELHDLRRCYYDD